VHIPEHADDAVDFARIDGMTLFPAMLTRSPFTIPAAGDDVRSFPYRTRYDRLLTWPAARNRSPQLEPLTALR
jgi:hypothetical protein